MPENRGLYNKFTVIRNSNGEMVIAPTFTLLLESDPFALPALAAYADAAEQDGGYDEMVADIRAYIADES